MQIQDKAIELQSDATAVTRSIYKSSFVKPATKYIFYTIDENSGCLPLSYN